MHIYKITDSEFNEYGKIVEGDFSEILEVLKSKACPCKVEYIPSDSELESVKTTQFLKDEIFGGLPIQIGYCNGHNQFLNCLEYHKSSEVNIAETNMVLLLGKQQDIQNGKYSTDKIKAFLVPAGCAVELYATTLHYAPCGIEGKGFRVIVALPQGTNYEKPKDAEDEMLWASNKWLIAHPDSVEAKQGAWVGLEGKNIEV